MPILQRIRRSPEAPPPPPPAEAAAPGEDSANGHPAPTTALSPVETPAVPAATWRVRGRLRRRARYLRAKREIALRDLGGLVFDLHRFGRERADLVNAKLESLSALDRCASCGELMASDARFCSRCGASAR